jgi:homocysteine S-methyltransferase
VLAAAGADVLACETVPCLAEAEALVAELDRLGHPGWLSLTTVPGPDGEPLTRLGEPAAEGFALAGSCPAVLAVGVNCTDPAGVGPAVRLAAGAGKPVLAYPNSGEGWDAGRRAWTGRRTGTWSDLDDWVAAGARLVGGCCRVGPEEIAELSRRLAAARPPAAAAP